MCFYTVERSQPEHRAMIKGPPCGGLMATKRNICKSSSEKFSFIHTARSPSDHLRGILRRPNRERPICGSFFPPNFGRWPTGHRQMFGRRPVGRRRMNKWPQTSTGHPANFNCELNLPDDRRTSAR